MTVVVGYVPTQTGFVAVREAAHEARARGSSVVLVNALGYAGYVAPTAADEQQLDAITNYLRDVGVEFTLRQVNQVQEKSSVAGVILDVAREVGAELIVLGLHRTSPLMSRLLGSTIQTITLSAACSVLIVPNADHA